MAYLPEDLQEADIVSFKGSTQAVDPYQIDLTHGLLSQNIDFVVTPSGTVLAVGRRGSSLISSSSSVTGSTNTSLVAWQLLNGTDPDCWALILKSGAGGAVYAWKQFTSTLSTLFSTSGSPAIMVVAFNGIQAFFAFADATGRNGVGTPLIYSSSLNAADELCPDVTTPTAVSFATATSGGSCTLGSHALSYLCTTRMGYVGARSSTAAPGTFITAGTVINTLGTQTIQIAFSPTSTWPAYMVGGTLQVVMTPATNSSEFYTVPGAIQTIATNTSTLTFNISITDGDLTATGTNVTEYPNNFQTNIVPIGVNPIFTPSAVFTYSSRMAYITVDGSGFPVVYFSDQNAYQQLNPAFYGIYLEGKQIPVQGCSIGSTCYIATLSALYTTSDNGGLPTTWTPPARIDGSVGILSPTCITSAGGRILIASEKGLFSYRGGAFPLIPMSYYQSPDWNRINWLAPTQVQVIDDGFDRVVRVIAPLIVLVTVATNANPIVITTAILINGAYTPYPHNFQTGLLVTIAGVTGNTNANGTHTITVTSDTTFTIPVAGNGTYAPSAPPYATATPNSPNAEMAWNYSIGEDPDSVMYSLNSFASFIQGAIGVIRNINTAVDEPWYMASSGPLIRRVLPSDTLVHRDVDNSGTAVAIHLIYKSGLLPGPEADMAATFADFHGAHFQLAGIGSVAIQVQGVTNSTNVTQDITPAKSPVLLRTSKYGVADEILVKWYLRSEQETIQCSINTVDQYFILSLIRAYWGPSLPFN